jgi:hypothetical protein
MFIGFPTNITATWQIRPATSTSCGSFVHRGTDEHKDFFLKISVLSTSPIEEPPKQVYNTQTTANTYTIYNNPTRQNHKYRSNTTATHQNPNITSPRMHHSLLHRVVVLRPSTACVEHRLGERFSLRGVMLRVQNLQDIDINMLDDHKTCKIQRKF